jgi:hypothetical protein
MMWGYLSPMRTTVGAIRKLIREAWEGDGWPKLSTVDVRTRIFDYLSDHGEATAEEILDWLADSCNDEQVTYDPQVARRIAQEEGRAKGSGEDADVLGAIRSLNKGGRIPLALIRPKLAALGLSRSEQDKALLFLQREEEIVLYRNDNPRDITNADKDAVLYVGDAPRHMVYVTPKRGAPAVAATPAAPPAKAPGKPVQRKVYARGSRTPVARVDNKVYAAPAGTNAKAGQKYGMSARGDGTLSVNDPSWPRSQVWTPERDAQPKKK